MAIFSRIRVRKKFQISFTFLKYIVTYISKPHKVIDIFEVWVLYQKFIQGILFYLFCTYLSDATIKLQTFGFQGQFCPVLPYY